MKSASLWDLVGGLFVVAVIYMLVRPSSTGPNLITAAADVMSALIRTATAGTNS